MTTIEIYDEDEHGVLAFDLAEVLEIVEPFGASLEWYFVEFEPVSLIGLNGSPDDPPLWVADLYQKLKTEVNSVKVKWELLKRFAFYVRQTLDTTLIAVHPGASGPTTPVDLHSPDYEIVIQGIDTSLWAVTSRNEKLITLIKGRFKKTKII